MSDQNLFTVEAFRKNIADHMNTNLQDAAEPLIQKALAEIEMTLRAEVAKFVIASIDQQFSVERMGQDIVVTVRGFGKDR